MKRLPHRDNTAQINEACRLIVNSNGLIEIKTVASETNMTIRTLERQFTKRVGVPPKTFARFKRFHHALTRLSSPEPEPLFKIAYECGYFDQAHFIKEFEAFTGILPSSYDPQKYPIFHQFVFSKSF